MFTGIVQGTGKIIEVIEGETIRSFKIQVPNTESLEIGASISVDGVCLTATSIENKIVSFDVIQETLKRTTLGQLEVGETVNIERSLKFGDEIGGHLLSGHIMATGIVNEKSESLDWGDDNTSNLGK